MNERGSVLIGLLVVLALVGGTGVAAVLLAQGQIQSGRRRVLEVRAQRVAAAGLEVVTSWFEPNSAGALVAPPPPDLWVRDLRQIDADGDGSGPLWSDSPAPWNRRFKEGSLACLFQPPDGPEAQDRFWGTPEGPDLHLSGPSAQLFLESWSRLLDPERQVSIRSIDLFRPLRGTDPRALASAEIQVEAATAGGPPIRVRARGEVVALDWGRPDRPLLVSGASRWLGQAGWGRGEAVIGGDLEADDSTVSAWPGGIPWAGPDRPVRDDQDGDGTPDDQDGDGTPDFTQWKDLPGAVPDPWWRGRVGGAWVGHFAALRPCTCRFPFGPLADPPQPPSKQADRSGLFFGCATAQPVVPIPGSWEAVARSGRRGIRRVVEDRRRPGEFRLDGVGPPQTLDTLLSSGTGLLWIVAARSPGNPLEVRAGRFQGGLVVTGADLRLTGGLAHGLDDWFPPPPRDSKGGERPGSSADPRLVANPEGFGCRGWTVDSWDDRGGATAGTDCGSANAEWTGLVAASGAVEVIGPARVVGQLRGGSLVVDGTPGPVEILAAGDPGSCPSRPGFPGLRRVELADFRNVR